MNGMQQKAARRRHAAQYTEDGLPRDAKQWREEDWRDLWHAMRDVIAKIALRRKDREERQ